MVLCRRRPIAFARRCLLQAGTLAALPTPALSQAREPVLLGLTPVFVDSDLQLLQAVEGELARPISAGCRVAG